MTPEEKQEQMFDMWLSGNGIEFVDQEAERSYRERVTRIKDAIQLKKVPDRVPVCPFTGLFPAYYAGITVQDLMYDYQKAAAAYEKSVFDFEPDAYLGMFLAPPGRFFEILDYKLYEWPGHGVQPDRSYQCLEAEYMKADEYDALIQDPSDFWVRVYFPRVFGALKPFEKLAPLTDVMEIVLTCGSFIPFGFPDVQAAFKAVLEAGNEALRWAGVVQAVDQKLQGHGFPALFGGVSKAPFDILGDTLRGTHGIMLDMYRQPEKLLKALEVLTPLAIRMGVSSAKAAGNPVVFMPLHKGADGFLSDQQFKTFYWSSLREVIMGLIEEGLVPFLFAEGGYNTRLEVIRDLPKGKTVWLFDNTDMAKAKEILGDTACIAGNVPISLLTLGTAEEVKDYCQKLIATAGKDGGFILCNGAVIDDIPPENLRALIQSAKEYGIYS
ncbi:uroporphyrinogen decarboxylase family protein [Desulfofundulus sp.]|uniref:uroporphyrinogen decarboxylase family protein n=1 Tax=Desulfofundulus sp. TaxID=2282750 RepID=UPI003C753DF0